jgi:DNA uptake protein ComE-like DNA-binding protein
MWGRELRAGLVFVLASVALGGAFRAWERAHHERLDEIVASLSESEVARAMAASRAHPAAVPNDTTRGGSLHESAPAPAGRASRARAPDAAPPRPASIDPDRATRDEWLRLPGIGPTLAARILADRAVHGPFGGPEGLLRVPGIGPKTLAKIQVYLTPSAAPAAGDSTVRDRAE